MTQWKILTFLAICVALLWETRPAYTLAYLFLFLFLALPAWQRKRVKDVQVRRSSEEFYLFPGDSRSLGLQVTNPTRLSFAWFSVSDRIPASLRTGHAPQKKVFALAPYAYHDIQFQITARERGVYRLGPLDVAVGDFFGIRTQQFQIDEEKTVIVFPNVHHLSELALPARLSLGNFKALQRINPDPTRLAGLRPYQDGDPLRHIHWPATARAQALQVKQFEHTVTATCVLFLDLHQKSYEVSRFYVHTELAITTAASLATEIIQRGEACGLVSNAALMEYLPDELNSHQVQGRVQVPPRQGLAQLTQILTILAGVETQAEQDFLGLLRESTYRLGGATIFLWIVAKDTPEIVREAWTLVRQGRQIQIFVIGEVLHPELLASPPGSSLQVFSVARGGARA